MHVHLFLNPQCAGESLVLSASADLCGLRYPSGAAAKDNVASVLLSSGVLMSTYGTCRLSETPVDPMLLQTLREPGCHDLDYPILGSVGVELLLRHDDADADGARAGAPEGPVAEAEAEAETDESVEL